MTKEQLEKLLGRTLEDGKDTYTDDEAFSLINEEHTSLRNENAKNKNIITQRNSEIAEFKRKEQDKLTEDEKRELHYKELEKNYATLQKTMAKKDKVTEYIGIGYPKELAEKVADAELEGKSTVEFHKQFLSSREESIKAELMKGQTDPRTGGNDKVITKEDYKKMTYAEKMELKDSQPELFEQFSKN